MGESGWGIVFLLGITAALALIITVAIWQVFAVAHTKMTAETELARDDAYHALAKEATAAQQATAEEQHKIASHLADLRERMTSIEKVMKEAG